MGRYAQNTNVSTEKSRGEIERILKRWGADAFSYGWEGRRALIQFSYEGWIIRFELPLPDRNDDEFTRTPSRRTHRSADAIERAWEQACRQRWRALALAVKAKLEAVECKITTFEEEFLAHLVLPSGETVGRQALPQIRHAYETGLMPSRLLALPPAPDEVIDAEVLESA